VSGQGKVARHFPGCLTGVSELTFPMRTFSGHMHLRLKSSLTHPSWNILKTPDHRHISGKTVSFPWPPEEKGWLLGAFTKWSIGPEYYKPSCLLRFASGRLNFSQLGSYGHYHWGYGTEQGLAAGRKAVVSA